MGKMDERIITKHNRKYKNNAFAMNECNEQSGFPQLGSKRSGKGTPKEDT